MDNLLSSPIKPATSKQDIGSLPTSDQELPEPSTLLVGKKKSSVSSGSNSYDDSEMDQWAANIPSEVLDVDEDESIFFPITEHARHIGQSSKSDAPTAPKGTKRQVNLVEEHEPHGRDAKRFKPLPVKINDSVRDLDTPVRKKPTVGALPTPFSASPLQREVVGLLLITDSFTNDNLSRRNRCSDQLHLQFYRPLDPLKNLRFLTLNKERHLLAMIWKTS